MVHTSARLVDGTMAARIRTQVAALVEAGRWTTRESCLLRVFAAAPRRFVC
jgi:hypothetical protein